MKSKLLLGAAVTAAMGWTTGAQAITFFQCSSSPLTDCVNYDVTVPAGPTGLTIRTAVDWNQTGTVVAQGTGPFGSDLEGHPPITEIYQSNSVDFTGGANPPNLNTLEDGSPFTSADQFNFTTVFNFEETVESITGDFPDQTVRFGVVPGSGTVSIFYNDLSNGGVTPDHIPGTGYDNGLEVARFTIVSGVSRFSADPPLGVSGSGTATYDFILQSEGDFVDPDFFLATGTTVAACDKDLDFGTLYGNGCITGYHWTATLGFPDSDPPTAYTVDGSALYPDYSVVSCAGIDPNVNPNTCDLVFHVDGVGQFRNAPIPEIDTVAGSGAFALLGGMLMLVGERRRARKSA